MELGSDFELTGNGCDCHYSMRPLQEKCSLFTQPPRELDVDLFEFVFCADHNEKMLLVSSKYQTATPRERLMPLQCESRFTLEPHIEDFRGS